MAYSTIYEAGSTSTTDAFPTEHNHVLVAAIDFGTTYSGYAYSFTKSPLEIILTDWMTTYGAHAHKIPTAVLVDGLGKFVDFGHGAIEKYYNRHKKGYRLFNEKFKMRLYDKQIIDKSTTIKPRDNQDELPLINIIAMALQYLYENLLDELQKSSAEDVDQSMIRLVLTVPAIWTDGAKSFMRDAAIQAGLVNDDDPSRLLIALEPEAASYWCRNLSPNNFKPKSEREDILPVGTVYMVVDCGGGTVDITIHEVEENDRVREIKRPRGGDWGGTTVNDLFEKEITELLGHQYVHILKEKHRHDWIILMNDFESTKRKFNPDHGDEIVMQPLSQNFASVHKAFVKDGSNLLMRTLKRTKSRIEFPDNCGYKFDSSKIVIPHETMEHLHEYATKGILHYVRELLTKPIVAKSKYIFLVGGFSESAVLYKHVKDAIQTNNRKVLRPISADLAVLRGAVLYGHAPAQITSRIARMTYGQSVHVAFVEGKHNPLYMTWIDGEKRCTNIFTKWVEKNQPVNIGDRRPFEVFPHAKSTKKSTFSIYAVDRENVTYVKEDGVELVAQFDLNTPDTNMPMCERHILIYVSFGGTELHVRAENAARKDGDCQEIKLKFNCR